MDESGTKAVARGRPRDDGKRQAILAAAYDLVLRRGYVGVTTAEIAAAAGSGKQTIYRWWPTKAELVLDALEHWAERSIDFDTKGATLRVFLARVCEGASRAGPVLRSLMGQAQFDAEMRALLLQRLIEPRRDALRTVLRDCGVKSPRQREALVLAIYGALWYRLLLDEPLDKRFVESLIEARGPWRMSSSSMRLSPETGDRSWGRVGATHAFEPRKRSPGPMRLSRAVAERPHGTKPHGEQLGFRDGDMRALASAGRRRPEGAGLAAPAAGLDGARQHEHEFVGRMGVDRDGRARREARAVDGAAGHRLGERHELDARQKVDPRPSAGARIDEGLMAGHCATPLRVGNLRFRLKVT